MESRLAGRSVGVGRILWGFSNGYLKIVGTQFLKGLILFAVIFGSMLPGLILILVGVLSGLGAAGIFGLMLLLCGAFCRRLCRRLAGIRIFDDALYFIGESDHEGEGGLKPFPADDAGT